MGHEQTIDLIFRVTNRIISQAKKKVVHVGDISLYPSEVHMLLLISNEIDTNATEMARHLCLTKGAVSQTITRLEKKGILKKIKDNYKKNELTLILTEFGKVVSKKCQHIENTFTKRHDKYLSSISEDEKEAIHNFLEHMENVFRN